MFALFILLFAGMVLSFCLSLAANYAVGFILNDYPLTCAFLKIMSSIAIGGTIGLLLGKISFYMYLKRAYKKSDWNRKTRKKGEQK